MPVILAALEAKIRKMKFKVSPAKKLSRPKSQSISQGW
jgi:hypothetical protein